MTISPLRPRPSTLSSSIDDIDLSNPKNNEKRHSLSMSQGTDKSEEDLRVLRRKRRETVSSTLKGIPKATNATSRGPVPVPPKVEEKSTNSSASSSAKPTNNAKSSAPTNNSSNANTVIKGQSVKSDEAKRLSIRAHSPIKLDGNRDNATSANPKAETTAESLRRSLNGPTNSLLSSRDSLNLSPPASPPRGPPPANNTPNRATSAPNTTPNRMNDYQKKYGSYNGTNNAPIEDMAIRVVVRKRPISRGELARGDRDVMEIMRGGVVLLHEPKVKVDLTKHIETSEFIFDDAFSHEDSNEIIYDRTIKHLMPFVFDGGKATCFAYGQTGSGKTFSMMGCSPDDPASATVNAGLYVLAARDIYTFLAQPQYQHLNIYVSCFEIYGGKLLDLLNERSIVKCLEDAKQQVQLPGLTEHYCRSVEELLNLMAMAHEQRSTGSTGANESSSRSHQVMQIVLKDAKPKRKGQQGSISDGGKLSFIDLAGSERGADTTHASKQTRMEGAEINTSLLALKEVIRSLEKKNGYTPFRGSKLTQVLKDSFVGEKTRTCMIACVSPSHSNCEHTLNTLRYADRVKEHQSSGSNPNVPAASSAGANNAAVVKKVSNPNANNNINSNISSSNQVSKDDLDKPNPPPSLGLLKQKSAPILKANSQSKENNNSNNSKVPSTRIPGTNVNRRLSAAPIEAWEPSSNSSNNKNPKNSEKVRKSSEKDSIDSKKSLSNTDLIQRTVDLLSAHRSSIAEMVEVMKDEMELVQNMENMEDRDSESYVNRLDIIMELKSESVRNLRDELKKFQEYRKKNKGN